MESTVDIKTDFLPQAAENYGAEFGFVKYLAHKFTLFLPLFPLKYDAIVNNFSPQTVTGSNSVLDLGNPNTELGNSILNGGKSILNGGKSVLNRGKSIPNGGKSIPNGGKSVLNRGKSIPNGGNSISNGGNSALNGGNSAPYKNKEKL
jgi:hypothetical protein